MADRIQLRRDTAANWTAYNPILFEGEPGIEIDTDQWKLGDGVHTWSQLAYRGGECVQQRGQSTTVAMSQKAVTDELNLIGVFDISAHNLTDGQPTKYADLTAALGTNGANVPTQYRVPGMTVRYVQSSDNKYVQYFLTKDEWSASETDWEKMNLEEEVSQLDKLVNSYLDLPILYETGSINALNGKNADNSNRSRTAGFVYLIDGMSVTRTASIAIILIAYDKDKTYLGYSEGRKDFTYQTIITEFPTAKYIRLVDESSTSFKIAIDTNGVYSYINNKIDESFKIGTAPEKTTLGLIDWDGEGTTINAVTGKDIEYANRNRAKGYFNIVQASKLLFNAETATYYVFYYDAQLNYISYERLTVTLYDFVNAPNNAIYFRLVLDTAVSDINDVEFGKTHLLIEEQENKINQLDQDVYGTLAPVEWAGQGKALNVLTGGDTDTADRNRTNYLVIDDIKTIVFDSQSPKYYVCFYDSNKDFISPSIGWKTAKTYDLSDAYNNAVYVRIMIDTTTVTPTDIVFNCDGLMNKVTDSAQLIKNAKSIIVVDANGNGDYTTIEDALANANDDSTHHITIFVKPGEYWPAPQFPGNIPYESGNRNVSVIGLDRDRCILKGNVGYYYWQEGVDYALLRLSGNVLIKNLTFVHTCENYISVATEKGWDLTSPHARAYCIHNDSGAGANTTMRIENCKMYNDHFACVGYGLRANATFIINDCECISDVSAENNTLSGFSSEYGTLYGHLAPGQTNAPNQRLEVKNCLIRNTNYERGIAQQDASGASDYSNISAQFLFVRNIIRTVGQVTPYSNSIPSSVYTIDNWSYGNNVDSMNYSD